MTGVLADIFPPVSEAFRSGILVMPQDIVSTAAETVTGWSGIGVNGWFIALSALAVVIDIRGLYYILPDLSRCITRWRWNITAENSMQFSRERDIFALLTLLPVTVICSRFGLIRPRMFSAIPEAWHTPAVLGILLAYLLTRIVIYGSLRQKARRVTYWQVAHSMDGNFLILFAMLASVTAAVLWAIGLNDLIIRYALIAEAAFSYLLLLAHKNQILGSSCNPFATFLYLCALEILPTGLLVISMMAL